MILLLLLALLLAPVGAARAQTCTLSYPTMNCAVPGATLSTGKNCGTTQFLGSTVEVGNSTTLSAISIGGLGANDYILYPTSVLRISGTGTVTANGAAVLVDFLSATDVNHGNSIIVKDGGNQALQVTKSGIYHAVGQVHWGESGSDLFLYASVQKKSSISCSAATVVAETSVVSNDDIIQNFSGYVSLSANDYAFICIYAPSTRSIQGAWLSLHYVSP